MTEDDAARDDRVPAEDVVRTEKWPTDGPVELDLSIDVGRIEVALGEQAGAVEVEVRADPSRAGGWAQGLSGVLNWLGEATGHASTIRIGGREFPFGGADVDPGFLASRDLGAEAVRAAEITWSETARRLLVRSSTALPPRMAPLAVTVRAPAGSRLTLRTGSGDVTVTGWAGDTGVRTGSGDVTLAAVAGPAEVRAGSGDVRLGGVRADLHARTGSGDLTVGDAESGRLELTTGSGDLRVGVHAGVIAELDVSSGSGRTRSELDVHPTAPSGDASTLVIRGRTGSGDVLVTRASAATS